MLTFFILTIEEIKKYINMFTVVVEKEEEKNPTKICIRYILRIFIEEDILKV